MKKTAIIVVLIWALFVSILFPYRIRAEALGDPMTLAQISGLAYALGSSFGLNFDMNGITADGTKDYMESEINKWLGGSTIIEKFGSEAARLAAGKLIIPAVLYNGIRDFLSQFVSDKDIGPTSKQMIYQSGNFRVSTRPDAIRPGSDRNYFVVSWDVTNLSTEQSYIRESANYSDVNYKSGSNGGVIVKNNAIYGVAIYVDRSDASSRVDIYIGNAGSSVSSVGASLNGEIPQTVLNPDEQWTGTLGGQDWPDTNLDQLIGQIYDDVADNNLSVDGEVGPIDPPPTPVPTVIPGDIDGYWNRQSEQLEGLGNDIGDISGQLDDLGQQAGDIADALEGVNQGIQSQTGVISGALDQATQDVVDAIGEQTGVLDESLKQTAEGVQEIADALQPGEIESRQFDLRRLFPFCIPFDIHNLLQKFNAEPVAPHVQLPFVIQSIGFSYMFDLDFSAFDPVAAAMRTVEFIVFAIGLAWATSKVIKW